MRGFAQDSIEVEGLAVCWCSRAVDRIGARCSVNCTMPLAGRCAGIPIQYDAIEALAAARSNAKSCDDDGLLVRRDSRKSIRGSDGCNSGFYGAPRG
jgi:hypothetical protein